MMEIITVSEKARIQIQKLLEEQKLNRETHFLRVGVKDKNSNLFFSHCFPLFMPKTKERIVLVTFNQKCEVNDLLF